MSYDLEDGSSQRITYTPNTASYASQMSMSFWFKPESLPGGNQMQIVDLGAAALWNPRNFGAYWTPASGGQVGISWINSIGPTFGEWTSGFSLSTGVWHNWYYEVDWTTNPDTVLLWIDGSSVTLSNTFGTNNLTPTGVYGQLSIGGEHGLGTTGNYVDGKLSDITIWSDVIGSTRAAALWNSGSGAVASTAYPTNMTENISFRVDLSNSVGGTGTGLNSPTFSTDNPFAYPSGAIVKDTIGSGFIPFAR